MTTFAEDFLGPPPPPPRRSPEPTVVRNPDLAAIYQDVLRARAVLDRIEAALGAAIEKGLI